MLYVFVTSVLLDVGMKETQFRQRAKRDGVKVYSRFRERQVAPTT